MGAISGFAGGLVRRYNLLKGHPKQGVVATLPGMRIGPILAREVQ
jgi:hypothetical protein